MKTSKAVRNLDELGRLVLPEDIRSFMQWYPGSMLDVYINESDRTVVIKTHSCTCSYCNSTENLKEYKHRYVCQDCQAEISEL